MTPHTPNRDNFLEELYSEADDAFGSGRTNNLADIWLTIGTVLGSLAATGFVAHGANAALAASVAALPAACTAIQTKLDVRGRSIWYFQRSANIKALAVSLKYAETPDLEEFAKKRSELEIEDEKLWSQVGRGRAGPAKRKKL